MNGLILACQPALDEDWAAGYTENINLDGGNAMTTLTDPWWVKRTGNEITLGLTPTALTQLGKLYFLDFPAPGAVLKVGLPFATIEAQHWIVTLNSPIAGQVVALNPVWQGQIEPAGQTSAWLLRLVTV